MSEIMNAWWNIENKKAINSEELIKKISFDKRLDGFDLPEVLELESFFNGEKEQIHSQAKENLLSQIEKTLHTWFTVEKGEDYEVLKRILSILGKKSILPDYIQLSHIADKTGKSHFSIVLNTDKNVLEIYSRTRDEVEKNKQVSTFSLRWSLSLEDGSFISTNMISQYKTDFLPNNNEFDINKK